MIARSLNCHEQRLVFDQRITMPCCRLVNQQDRTGYGRQMIQDNVKFDVVTDYGKLIEIVYRP